MGIKRQQSVEEQCDLLLKEGHLEHEDIVGYLQHNPSPYSIPYLKRAIALKPKLAHLDYDDYGSFYKKCLWALQAIGTADAVDAIREFAQSDDPILREQAAYRLVKISKRSPDAT